MKNSTESGSPPQLLLLFRQVLKGRLVPAGTMEQLDHLIELSSEDESLGSIEEVAGNYLDLASALEEFINEANIALKLLNWKLAVEPFVLSNEKRREWIRVALEIGIDPNGLLRMLHKHAENRIETELKPYDPSESKSGSRQGERKKRS